MDKTFIVGINLHGEIPLDSSGNPETKTIEQNYIIKLNGVSPGVPNISTLENYNNLNNITRKLVKKNPWLKYPMKSDRLLEGYKEKMVNFVTEIKNKFIEENTENIKGIEKEYSKKRRFNDVSEHEQNFIHNKDSIFKITSFETGDTIANKLFLKFTPDELEQLGIDEHVIADEGFNKIIIYNLDNTDVFQLLGEEYQYITLFNLIDLLTGMGAENIIFIDLSCSVFTSDPEISKRTIRTVRRRLTKSSGRQKVPNNNFKKQ